MLRSIVSDRVQLAQQERSRVSGAVFAWRTVRSDLEPRSIARRSAFRPRGATLFAARHRQQWGQASKPIDKRLGRHQESISSVKDFDRTDSLRGSCATRENHAACKLPKAEQWLTRYERMTFQIVPISGSRLRAREGPCPDTAIRRLMRTYAFERLSTRRRLSLFREGDGEKKHACCAPVGKTRRRSKARTRNAQFTLRQSHSTDNK